MTPWEQAKAFAKAALVANEMREVLSSLTRRQLLDMFAVLDGAQQAKVLKVARFAERDLPPVVRKILEGM